MTPTKPGIPPTLRLLAPADADAYWRLRLEMLEREPRAYGTSAEEHRATTVADAARRLAGDGAWTVGALVGGATPGGSSGPGERLRGAATLVREARRKTRHKATVAGVYVGLERLTLAVAATQPAAEALYRALGFVAWGREAAALRVEADGGAEYVDELYLSRVL